MRVQVHPCDGEGCGWYRLRWPVKQLQADGHDVVIGAKIDCERLTAVGSIPDRPVRVLTECDVLVLQRPLRHEVVEIIPVAQRQGIAVVVEIDDDFHALPKGHVARREFAPANNAAANRNWLRAACAVADLVTCTTPAIAARYAPHGRSAVLPNLVPESYLNVNVKREPGVTIGWTGTPVTHVGDLDVLGNSVRVVLDETDARFRAIGSALTLRKLGVQGDVADWAPLLTLYPREVARLDIGLVPLAPNAFNEAKSALKLSEYAALGVAAIASPTADNLRMANLGVGFVASDRDDWLRAMSLLVRDESYRADLVAQGRSVMAGHTYEGQSWRWLDAWERAVNYRRQQTIAALT